MSVMGLSSTAARNKSGRWVMAMLPSNPPPPLPKNASFCEFVYLFAINHSAAATRSSTEACLWSRTPAVRHVMPNSPPPRTSGTAIIPPASNHGKAAAENNGLI